MRSTQPVVALLGLGLVVAACGGCGGSTAESTPPPGGNIVDSALPDVAEAGPEAGPDVETDAPDVPDTSVDQAVEDTAAPDAEDLEGSLFDLTMPDVALNDSGATVQGCYDCASSSCGTEMAACEEDDKCRTLVLCLFVDQCLGGSGPGGVDTGCAFGCVNKAGISDYTDPAVAVALDVATCVNGTCQAECALPDGGVIPPMDGGGPG